jgi:acetamidase/formamidase
VIHELPHERRTLHGHFSRDLAPVLSVERGDSVRFATPDADWRLESRERVSPRMSPEDDGHALAGPIEIRGASAGQTLVVGIDEVTPGPWGTTWAEPSHRVDWTLEGGVGRASTGHTVRLRPFLGVLGVPPASGGVHSTIPPRAQGGNIDCKELVAGSTLYLPIAVDGALFSAGDGHAAQGDGEVSGTAIECPTSAQVTLAVRDDLPLGWPCARIDGAWLTFGFDEQLGRAAEIAVEGMLELMGRERGLAREDALALASVVVDLRVTQVVNGVKGVHAVLRDDALR